MKAAILSAAIFCCTTATAYSKNMVMPPRNTLTLEQTIKWQKKIIRHDRWVIHTAKRHTPFRVSFARKQLLWTRASLKDSLTVLHSRFCSTHVFTCALSSGKLPPHAALWNCIHNHEGSWNNRDTGQNGHYGGLQMHPGWGYGTSYYASDDPPLVQMWAAEMGYRANNYSRTWLLGQWYHPDCVSQFA